MNAQNEICNAIKNLKLISFIYKDYERVVEPHQLGFNKADNLALSAFWIRGYSSSDDTKPGWRAYLVDEISNVRVLSESFSGPRPGYQKAPNSLIPEESKLICEL
jgi:hypothetical protein